MQPPALSHFRSLRQSLAAVHRLLQACGLRSVRQIPGPQSTLLTQARVHIPLVNSVRQVSSPVHSMFEAQAR